jgi:hypothetical protein
VELLTSSSPIDRYRYSSNRQANGFGDDLVDDGFVTSAVYRDRIGQSAESGSVPVCEMKLLQPAAAWPLTANIPANSIARRSLCVYAFQQCPGQEGSGFDSGCGGETLADLTMPTTADSFCPRIMTPTAVPTASAVVSTPQPTAPAAPLPTSTPQPIAPPAEAEPRGSGPAECQQCSLAASHLRYDHAQGSIRRASDRHLHQLRSGSLESYRAGLENQHDCSDFEFKICRRRCMGVEPTLDREAGRATLF